MVRCRPWIVEGPVQLLVGVYIYLVYLYIYMYIYMYEYSDGPKDCRGLTQQGLCAILVDHKHGVTSYLYIFVFSLTCIYIDIYIYVFFVYIQHLLRADRIGGIYVYMCIYIYNRKTVFIFRLKKIDMLH